MIRLGLIRHGPTAWNRAGRLQGRSDIPLDEDAHAELAALFLPAPWDKAQLCSSPLARAMQTARLITGQEPAPVPDLIEMNWGAWEGQHGADLLADPNSGYCHIEDWGWAFRPPGGESVGELRDRVMGWVSSLEQDTVAVCHIGVMRVLLAVASGWAFDGPAPFRVKRRRIYGLEWADGTLSSMGEAERLIQRDAL